MLIPETIIHVPLRTEADGTIRIGATRVTLDIVIKEYGNGASVEEIVQKYESLNAADIHYVIGYYLEHQAAVDAYIAQRIATTQRIRQEWEKQHPPAPMPRSKLEAWQESKRKQGDKG